MQAFHLWDLAVGVVDLNTNKVSAWMCFRENRSVEEKDWGVGLQQLAIKSSVMTAERPIKAVYSVICREKATYRQLVDFVYRSGYTSR